jgi:SAM-dependent methyltransferase
MVVHHVPDLGACVGELHRVLKPGGLVLIRNAYRDRLAGIRHYEFFPSAGALDEARLPSVEAMQRAFEAGHFRLVALEPVEQVIDRTFREHVDRLRLRGMSTLALISDKEFEQGMARLEDAARSEDPARPVTEVIDLMVFKRC